MTSEKCKYFEECSAPLCPFDKEGLEFGIWYPDEEVCRKRIARKWIRKQRWLVKRNANPDLYFDVKMLESRAWNGKDPDKIVRREKEIDAKIDRIYEKSRKPLQKALIFKKDEDTRGRNEKSG